MDPQDQTQAFSAGSTCLYLLNRLAGLRLEFLTFTNEADDTGPCVPKSGERSAAFYPALAGPTSSEFNPGGCEFQF